jgi:uncharacterized protein YciU (UPF0263 family)
MVRLSLSDEQLLARLKDLGGLSTKGSLSSIRRHKDGSGGQPSAQTIGFYQKALGISDADIDELLDPKANKAPGLPGAAEFRSQFEELVEELKRRSNLPFEVQRDRAEARAAISEHDLARARKHLEAAANVTRKTADYANEEHARSLAALGALAFTERDFVEARTRYGEAINLPGVTEERLQRYKHFYLVASNATMARVPCLTDARNVFAEMATAGVEPNVVTYTTLINLAETYEEARKIFAEMATAGVEPDVVTYNTLINLAETYEEARNVFAEMATAEVEPDVVTYNTLINLAETYEEARNVFAEMATAGVQPNVVTYNTLINRAETYDQASEMFEQLILIGPPEHEITLTTLVKKAHSFEQRVLLAHRAKEHNWFTGKGFYESLFSFPIDDVTSSIIIDRYKSLPYHYETALEGPIRRFMKRKRFDDAFSLCLFFPHLGASKRVYRDYYTEFSNYMISKKGTVENLANYYYSFGMAAHENEDWPVARTHLATALALATAQGRIDHINRMLESIP